MSESTVRRWVDDGHLPSRRTAGGHRRIALQDVVAYARSSGRTLVAPETLGFSLGALEALGEPDPAAAFATALEEGRGDAAVGHLLAAFVSGSSVADLCDGFVRPALRRIGELWRGGQEGILVEHRATAICHTVLHRLQGLLPEPRGPLALGGALSRDPYSLPSLMAATVLRAESFRTVNLGVDLPAPVLAEGIRFHRPALVWITVGHVGDVRQTRGELLDLFEAHPGPTYVVGGRRAGELRLPPSERVHLADSMRELRALAVGLRSTEAAGGSEGLDREASGADTRRGRSA